ncbi:MAG: response regulator [Scandinavium sp.]|uniref:response regulator n=1 Tax=Scandinavium sp. TaxID=2830653 RepID=UPI003F3E4172
MKILLVEDHPTLREMTALHLTRSGHQVDKASTLAEAMHLLRLTLPDAVVLDLGLPDGEGLTLLKSLRERQSALPVLIVTARDTLSDRLNGLNLGADDYLVKPFEPQELEARLRAVSRRHASGLLGEVLELGALRLDLSRKTLTVNDRPLTLPRKERLLLEALLLAGKHASVKEVLEERIYGFNEPVTPNALEAVVSRLRRHLAEAGADVTIRTLRGIGYQLSEGDVNAKP